MLSFYIPFLLLFWLALAGLAALLISWVIEQPYLLFLWLILLAIVAIAFIQTTRALGSLSHPIKGGDGPFELTAPRETLQELYDLALKVAGERRLPGPHEVRIAADSVAYVFEDHTGRRILVLGGTALMLIPENALAGIIAHELGHFGARDTQLSRRGFRRATVMAHLESCFDNSPALALNPLVWLVRAYHWAYLRAWAAYSQQQEYRADQQTVAQVGKKTAAAALVYLTVPDRMPWVRLWSIVESHAATRQPLDALFAEQLERMKTTRPSDWEEAYEKALRAPTGDLDSHPCLRDRLKAIGVSPKKALAFALEMSGPPLAERLEAWPVIEKILTQRLSILAQAVLETKMEMAQIFMDRQGGK